MISQIKRLWLLFTGVLFLVIFITFSCFSQENLQAIPEARLKDLFLQYIASISNGADIKLTRFNIRGDHLFPPGHSELEILRTSKGKISGRISMVVAVIINGKEEGRIYLTGWVNRYELAVCAVKRISRGTILSEQDVCLNKIDVSKTPSNIVTDMDEVKGRRLKQSVKAGGYLRQNMLDMPPLIQKGDIVTMTARRGRLSVVTSGTARTSGVKDDQIKVQNNDTGRVITARIVDEASVEVVF